MNWQEIKSKYPRSWAEINNSRLFIDKIYIDTNNYVNISHEWDRHLYDFFDENGLWIEVSAASINDWSYDIFKLTKDNFECIKSGDYHKGLNRHEAESMAFIEAFEILEDKLSAKNK